MNDEEFPFNTLFGWLDILYTQAIQGRLGTDSAKKLAYHYRSISPDIHQAAESLITWESSKAATSGFITGLGGVVALPVTLPAGLTGLLFIQFRMIAAVAILGGHSPDDIRTRNLIYLCLSGSVAKELLHSAGMHLFRQLSSSALETMSEKVITTLMKRIITGVTTGSAARLLPLMGGIISGGIDWLLVHAAGALAREVFLSE
ncbi:EcsC family protein [Serratia proteamaculans]|uniref:EcsC family protein n=1 Tax=Serratia proteamaculans TaxID=28151 RepID=UPI0039BE8320